MRSADVNPYILYSKVVGLTSAAPTTPGTTPTVDPVAQELAATRKSVNDLVRGEMKSLMNMSVLSSADKQRLAAALRRHPRHRSQHGQHGRRFGGHVSR